MACWDRTAEFRKLANLYSSGSRAPDTSVSSRLTSSSHGDDFRPNATSTNDVNNTTSSLSGHYQNLFPSSSSSTSSSSFISEDPVATKANEISRESSEVTVKLGELKRLVKKKGIFEDNTATIQNLIFQIKQSITKMNTQLVSMDNVVSSSYSSSSFSNHYHAHSKAVVESLRNKLLGQTKEFKELLELRAQTMKVQDQRRNMYSFSSNLSSAPVPSSSSSSSSSATSSSSTKGRLPRSSPHDDDDMSTNQSLGGGGVDVESGALLHTSAGTQLSQMFATQRDSGYHAARVEAVESVQRMIGDLAQIFNKVATLVTQQEDMVMRIDDDVDTSLYHLREGEAQLYKYLRSISSNRSLILKVFGILLSFIVFFIIFLA